MHRNDVQRGWAGTRAEVEAGGQAGPARVVGSNGTACRSLGCGSSGTSGSRNAGGPSTDVKAATADGSAAAPGCCAAASSPKFFSRASAALALLAVLSSLCLA